MPPKAAAKAPTPLVNPRRSAHASIRGYLYQACLSAQRWLELGDDEILICEGDEDIDRLVRGGDDRIGGVSGVSEQAKDYTSKFGKEAVRDVLAGFAVTYHAVRERGDDRRFRLITTAAQPASGSSATADLIDRWASADDRDAVVEGARAAA